MSKWVIFRCKKDDCWVVSVVNGDIALGVAECPDEKTARVVMQAMIDRDKNCDK